jgi:nitrogen fixation/metabolism regulation signal transduction histidine kinase
LETVLGNLSSGVMSFDGHIHLQTANNAADAILHAEIGCMVNSPLPDLSKVHPHLKDLLDLVGEHLLHEKPWREEVHFNGPYGRQDLLCRGTPLFDAEGLWQGAVVVFDDVTALIQAQRRAAWGEVAQRLAHEIKNPLTPIQLSAERLKLKLTKSLNEADAEVLDKSTRTIVQQVEAMKSMVNAFAEYAKPSVIHLQPVNLSGLVDEVAALYPSSSGLNFELVLERDLPKVSADPVRMRQVLHNMLKNAQEANPTGAPVTMSITTQTIHDNGNTLVEILLRDNGPGIPPEQAERVFDPYVTTKNKGTGLGLAIVKKIIEEHGGTIHLEQSVQAGASFAIRLPLIEPGRELAAEGIAHG